MATLPKEVACVEVLRKCRIEKVAQDREPAVAGFARDHGGRGVEISHHTAGAETKAPIADAREGRLDGAADGRQPAIGRDGKLPSGRRGGLGPGTGGHDLQRDSQSEDSVQSHGPGPSSTVRHKRRRQRAERSRRQGFGLNKGYPELDEAAVAPRRTAETQECDGPASETQTGLSDEVSWRADAFGSASLPAGLVSVWRATFCRRLRPHLAGQRRPPKRQ